PRKRPKCGTEVHVKPRLCDLCGELADPYFLSPRYAGVSNFFTKLVELTPEQRAKAEIFIQRKRQATICSRHFEKETKKINDDRLRAEKTLVDHVSRVDEETIK
ncbi:hypothetical protein PMAYCL1PPCAC_01176, partial [Pristionchus mayeri]